MASDSVVEVTSRVLLSMITPSDQLTTGVGPRSLRETPASPLEKRPGAAAAGVGAVRQQRTPQRLQCSASGPD
eukprot:11442337-Prorocentrum_lima.AAC.1